MKLAYASFFSLVGRGIFLCQTKLKALLSLIVVGPDEINLVTHFSPQINSSLSVDGLKSDLQKIKKIITQR
jgi:hypothetical protein